MSVIVAVLVYVALRWLLPAIGGANTVLRALGEGLRDRAWMFAMPFLVAAGAAAFNRYYRRRLLDAQSGLKTLRALSWQDFERLAGGGRFAARVTSWKKSVGRLRTVVLI